MVNHKLTCISYFLYTPEMVNEHVAVQHMRIKIDTNVSFLLEYSCTDVAS